MLSKTPHDLATATAITGSAVLGWDVYSRRDVLTSESEVFAPLLLIISLAIVYATRGPSVSRLWCLIGAATFMLFLGGRAGIAWLLLLGSGVIHLVAARSAAALLLVVPCWLFGVAALFVAADVTARLDVARRGGQITSSEIAVASRWVVIGGLAIWLGRTALSIGHRHPQASLGAARPGGPATRD